MNKFLGIIVIVIIVVVAISIFSPEEANGPSEIAPGQEVVIDPGNIPSGGSEEPPSETEAVPLAESCEVAGGTWLAEFNECEYVSAAWCDASGGSFTECESACRNDSQAEVCTLQCVPVCAFGE